MIVPGGVLGPTSISRDSGFLVSMAGGPLTTEGQHRVDRWRQLWQQRGEPALPLLLTDLGKAITGTAALEWLVRRLPVPEPVELEPPAATVAPASGSPAEPIAA